MKKLKTSAEFFLNEARSITKISKELADITAKMKDLAAEFYQFRSQGAYAERLEEIKSELRDLTPKKKALMAELDNSIAGKDRNIELDIKESNNEDELTESADKWTLYVDGEKIKTFNSKKAAVTAYNKVVNSDDSTWDKATIKVGSDLYESTTNEGKFNRLPRKLDVMWDLKNTISSMFFKHSRGDDYDQDEMKSIESNIKDIKKAVKTFSNADDVKGTEYEVLESALTEAIEVTQDMWDNDWKLKKVFGKEYDANFKKRLEAAGSKAKNDDMAETWAFKNFKQLPNKSEGMTIDESIVAEKRTIQTKRHYTENHPAVSVGKAAKIRNKILEAIKDGRMTQSEFDRVVKEMSSDHKRWMKRNSNLFNVSEDGISLSGFGQKILKGITVNENIVNESFKSFTNSLDE